MALSFPPQIEGSCFIGDLGIASFYEAHKALRTRNSGNKRRAATLMMLEPRKPLRHC